MRELMEWFRDNKPGALLYVTVGVIVGATTAYCSGRESFGYVHWLGIAAMICTCAAFYHDYASYHDAKRRDKGIKPTFTKPRVKLFTVFLSGLIAIPASAFDELKQTPPRPLLSAQGHPELQAIGPAVGIGVIIAGGAFAYWLVKKCRQRFGTNGAGNHQLNNRFNGIDGTDEQAGLNNGQPYYSCGKRAPSLAGMDEIEEPIAPVEPTETVLDIDADFDADGRATITRLYVTPPEQTISAQQWEELMSRMGLRPDGRGHGEMSFSRAGQPIDYYDSAVYWDWDGAVVCLTPDGYYPSDLLTLEEAPEPSGPWQPVLMTRIPRASKLTFNLASDGERTFYRLHAMADQ